MTLTVVPKSGRDPPRTGAPVHRALARFVSCLVAAKNLRGARGESRGYDSTSGAAHLLGHRAAFNLIEDEGCSY